MDAEKLEFLFGSAAECKNIDDASVRRKLTEELYGSDEASPAGSLNRIIYSQVAEEIIGDDPPEVWLTAQRLRALGMDSTHVMRQLALAATSALVDSPEESDAEDQGQQNSDRYLAALKRLPLPPLADVVDLLVVAVSDNRQVPSDELLRQVLKRLGAGDNDWEVGRWVEQALDKLIDMRSDLMMIPPDRLVHPKSLFDGAVLTHRLSALEHENDQIEAGVDLLPLRWMDAPLLVSTGEEIEVTEDFDGSEVWEGPDGWLGRFDVNSLLSFRVDAASRVLSIETVHDIADADPELIRKIRAAYDLEVAEPWLPVDGDEIAVGVVVSDPRAFSEPCPPLGELYAAAGLERRGIEFAHEESVWRSARRFGVMRNVYDRLSDEKKRGQAARALDCAWSEKRDRASLREALESLSDLRISAVVADALLADAGGEVQLDDVDTFVRELLSAATGDPMRAPAHWLAAIVAEHRRDLVTAQARLERCVEADPDWFPGVDRLAWYLADRGDAVRAVRLWERIGIEEDENIDLREARRFASEPGSGLGRNDPCWCGSGAKFKHCHLGRPALPPLSDRVGWLYRKAAAYLERNGFESMQILYDLAVIRAGGKTEGDAFDRAFEDPLLVDVMFQEEGWFERFVDERGPLLPDDEAKLARAWAFTDRTLYETEEVRPGEGLTVRDLRTAELVEVRERTFSQQAKKGLVFCGRAIPDGESHQFFGGLFPVAPGREKEVLDLLDDGDGASLLDWVAATERPPELFNRESEPTLLCTAVVDVGDIEQARRSLDRLFKPDGNDSWIQTHQLSNGESIIRAVLRLGGTEITVEANSEERMDRVLKLLEEEIPGYRLVSDQRKVFDPDDLPTGRDIKPLPMEDPAVREMMKRVIAEREERWCDEEIPALGGLTPRQAADDPTRREALERLLLSYEHDFDEEDEELVIQYPPRLRRMLGID